MSWLIFMRGYVKEWGKWEKKDGNEPWFSRSPKRAWGKEQRRSHSGAADYKVWGRSLHRQEMMTPGRIPIGKQNRRKLMLALILKGMAKGKQLERERNRPLPTIACRKLQVYLILALVPETLIIILHQLKSSSQLPIQKRRLRVFDS